MTEHVKIGPGGIGHVACIELEEVQAAARRAAEAQRIIDSLRPPPFLPIQSLEDAERVFGQATPEGDEQ